ncbi:hypothetical protein [Patulibacter sp.]|uniref:hypothetical protein n=1 Tax=Patulibacter sp. TaxID=1912859 RepID=UPI0027227456|nr:hypothetical protein [Patulibacter sp.]MDO9409254.1 hypothetical protein [Patulibacter sp.]
MRLSLAVEQWRSGERWIAGLDGRLSLRAEDVAQATYDELRRRLGGAFTTNELVDLYESGVSWALDLASRVAPDDPDAWDSRVTDAAFLRYLGQAQDWGGGRIVHHE